MTRSKERAGAIMTISLSKFQMKRLPESSTHLLSTRFGIKVIVLAAVALIAPASSAIPDGAAAAQAREVVIEHSTSELIVQGTPREVFESILHLRDDSDDSIKELSRKGNQCVLEETFDDIPLCGKASCTYREVYIPYKRIEYKLLRSNRFKAFEGAWNLKPTQDGKGTIVSLSSYVDIDIPIPFRRQITRFRTMQGVKERLRAVKQSTEARRISMRSKAKTVK